MSRTVFADRFNEFVGQPPMTYWNRWRMQIASQWLAADRATVEEVATRLGYSSAAAFSRAFKTSTGHTPGSVRRKPRRPPRTLNEKLSPEHLRAS